MLARIATLHTALTSREDDGATAVEYGLIVFFIALVIIAGVTVLGTTLDALFKQVAAAI